MSTTGRDGTAFNIPDVQGAREMTAEIDRITEQEVQDLERQNREQAGGLGGKVLTSVPQNGGNPNLVGKIGGVGPAEVFGVVKDIRGQEYDELNPIQQERKVIASNEQVRDIAKKQEGYNEAAKYDTSTVGAETVVQAQEWLAEDREDIENENGLNGRYVKNLMDRNNKQITNETVAAVDKMIADNQYRPGELDRMANHMRIEFLKKVFNRILGSRN